MSKQKFQDLKDLIGALKKEEIILAKKHLTAFESYHTKAPSKMLRLLKLILKDNGSDYEKVKKRIGPEITVKSYNQLINRTLNRIEESLILDINLNRNKGYTPVIRNRLKIRKLIVQASILQGRGLANYALKNYNWIIKTAKKFELFDELIETLLLKQAIVFTKEGSKGYDAIWEQIKIYEDCREKLRIAKDLYRTYFAEISFKGKVQKKERDLKERVKKLEVFVDKTQSANIANYMYLLKMEYAFVASKYDYGLEVGKQFVNALFDNPVIFSNIRIGYVYFNLSDNEISAIRFKSAIDFGLKAKKTLKNYKSINYIVALDFLTTAYFFDNQLDEAEKQIQELESLKIIDKYPFHKGKLYYQKAMILFKRKSFKEANLLLNNIQEIEKDKEGWNVWIRIMRILCSIELLKLKLIDYDVESFRKYIQRIDKKYSIGKREKLILKILIDLDRKDFNFERVFEENIEVIDDMEKISGETSWDPKSPELIIFHYWFKSKLDESEYSPLFDKYKNRHIEIKKESKSNSNEDSSQLAIEF